MGGKPEPEPSREDRGVMVVSERSSMTAAMGMLAALGGARMPSLLVVDALEKSAADDVLGDARKAKAAARRARRNQKRLESPR